MFKNYCLYFQHKNKVSRRRHWKIPTWDLHFLNWVIKSYFAIMASCSLMVKHICLEKDFPDSISTFVEGTCNTDCSPNPTRYTASSILDVVSSGTFHLHKDLFNSTLLKQTIFHYLRSWVQWYLDLGFLSYFWRYIIFSQILYEK